jgi:Pyruvate/2-oxoacid:ferredoxin oxidoreductase gamma subunit
LKKLRGDDFKAFTLTATAVDASVQTSTGTFTIVDGDTIRTVEEEVTEDVQATLTNNGTRLTLVDDEGDAFIFDKR